MKKLSMEELLKQFNKEYDFLYENDNVAGEDEATEAFDEYLKHNSRLVAEFVRYRGDFIASDREAASFMFALEALGQL